METCCALNILMSFCTSQVHISPFCCHAGRTQQTHLPLQSGCARRKLHCSTDPPQGCCLLSAEQHVQAVSDGHAAADLQIKAFLDGEREVVEPFDLVLELFILVECHHQNGLYRMSMLAARAVSGKHAFEHKAQALVPACQALGEPIYLLKSSDTTPFNVM